MRSNMFPHTISVYTMTEDVTTLETMCNITVVKGVLVDQSKGVNIQKSGLATADAVTVYIPFSVDSGGKTFVPEKEYGQMADTAGIWTLRPGKDFFIMGEVVEPDKTRQQLETMYDGVHQVTTVDTKNFGTSDMHHWRIGGK